MKKTSEAPKSNYVVIRANLAGVHFGQLVSIDRDEVVLGDARKLWSWEGANTVAEIAISGPGPNSRVASAVTVRLLRSDCIEIISATAVAKLRLDVCKW